jgi:hypothetical protein
VVKRIQGVLLHIDHYVGPNSTNRHQYGKEGIYKFDVKNTARQKIARESLAILSRSDMSLTQRRNALREYINSSNPRLGLTRTLSSIEESENSSGLLEVDLFDVLISNLWRNRQGNYRYDNLKHIQAYARALWLHLMNHPSLDPKISMFAGSMEGLGAEAYVYGINRIQYDLLKEEDSAIMLEKVRAQIKRAKRDLLKVVFVVETKRSFDQVKALLDKSNVTDTAQVVLRTKDTKLIDLEKMSSQVSSFETALPYAFIDVFIPKNSTMPLPEDFFSGIDEVRKKRYRLFIEITETLNSTMLQVAPDQLNQLGDIWQKVGSQA